MDDLLGVSEEAVHAVLVEQVGLALRRTAWPKLKYSYYEGLLKDLKPRSTTPPALQQLSAMNAPLVVVSDEVVPIAFVIIFDHL